MWVGGELVHVEDLVLHDERMDARAPTHELTIAHRILRARRRIAGAKPGWAVTDAGIGALTGYEDQRAAAEGEGRASVDETAALDLLDGVGSRAKRNAMHDGEPADTQRQCCVLEDNRCLTILRLWSGRAEPRPQFHPTPEASGVLAAQARHGEHLVRAVGS